MRWVGDASFEHGSMAQACMNLCCVAGKQVVEPVSPAIACGKLVLAGFDRLHLTSSKCSLLETLRRLLERIIVMCSVPTIVISRGLSKI